MKLKLDENISRYLKTTLVQMGHNVMTVEDEGLFGVSDKVIENVSRSEDRILLTLDLEFADLRKYPPGTHPGIILFRPRSMGPLTVNDFILKFIKNYNLLDFQDCVVVVDKDRLRVRRP